MSDFNLKPADIGRVMRLSEDAINWAAANTLNTVAYDSRNERIPAQLNKNLNMRRPNGARRAAFFEVDKATAKKIEATLTTKRGWLAYHVDAGQRSAKSSGWEFQGKKWLIVPVEKKAFKNTRQGLKMKAGYRKNMVTIRNGANRALIFYRPKRGGNRNMTLIAVLVERTKFKKDFHFEKAIEKKLKDDGPRLLRSNLDYQHKRAMRRRLGR